MIDIEKLIETTLDHVHRVQAPVTHCRALAAAEDGIRAYFNSIPHTISFTFKTEEEAKNFKENAETAYDVWRYNTGRLGNKSNGH